jgi:hypothetical protein
MKSSYIQRLHYVLLMIPVQDKLENKRWIRCKRVGARFMIGKYIVSDKEGTAVKIYRKEFSWP